MISSQEPVLDETFERRYRETPLTMIPTFLRAEKLKQNLSLSFAGWMIPETINELKTLEYPIILPIPKLLLLHLILKNRCFTGEYYWSSNAAAADIAHNASSLQKSIFYATYKGQSFCFRINHDDTLINITIPNEIRQLLLQAKPYMLELFPRGSDMQFSGCIIKNKNSCEVICYSQFDRQLTLSKFRLTSPATKDEIRIDFHAVLPTAVKYTNVIRSFTCSINSTVHVEPTAPQFACGCQQCIKTSRRSKEALAFDILCNRKRILSSGFYLY